MFYSRITEDQIDRECEARPGLGRLQAYRVLQQRQYLADQARRYGDRRTGGRAFPR